MFRPVGYGNGNGYGDGDGDGDGTINNSRRVCKPSRALAETLTKE